ncbi:hypothetical protein TNCT_196381 [Trichonephila clavata]|uniref:Uncharacterized protein n=1 Tax=Trichonephila clavata TaxID=2740835 RepID=A0A8X6F3S5_TRICU|nr:hypothetical protein TNCT_196381 [Trichonephila clavata]
MSSHLGLRSSRATYHIYLASTETTDFHFVQTSLINFLQEICFRIPRDAKRAFSEFVASRSAEFYDTALKKSVSNWLKCVAANGLILINKVCSIKRYT